MNEKRILIKEVTAPCNGCSGAGENVCDKCHDWYMWQSSSTREEAIEKMAKAMCREDSSLTSCENCIHFRTGNCQTSLENWFLEDAEAALNALLEGHDD